MSETNVELARRSFDAVNRRDLDALLALNDPDVIAEPRIVAIEGGPLRGLEGVRNWWERIFSSFPDFSVEVIAIRSRGDVVISNLRAHGRGEGSGVPFEDPIWMASRVSDGKVVWWKVCRSEAEALKAAGLRE